MKTHFAIGVLLLVWADALASADQLLFMPQVIPQVCPGGKAVCPPQSTCCGLKEGGYACCPVPEATCCSDNQHCCPKNFQCDGTQCVSTEDGSSISWSTKVPTQSLEKENVKSVICPDQQSQCMDKQTCCKLPSGDWGCCPLPEAVCCSDKIHCCPHDYLCEVEAGTCKKKPHDGSLVSVTIPWSTTLSSTPISDGSIKEVKCDDKQSCEDGQTCCKLGSGQWGCCPLPEAVCCEDHIHCCPSGTKCNIAAEKCERKPGDGILVSVSIPWSTTLNSKPTGSGISGISEVGNVKCDAEIFCRDGQTCCKTKTGSWACCPIPKAVCCSDMLHCCPSGYTCQSGTGMCIKPGSELATLPLSEINPAEENGVFNQRCDEESSCPDLTTCCKMRSGKYGCCPLPEAVCCSDKVHCCPNGYSCNIATGTCDMAGIQIPWSIKVPALSTPTKKPSEPTAVAPTLDKSTCSGGAWCKRGSTCCESKDGTLRGCCEFENAVCCSDGTHCCPDGTLCDSGMCRSVDSSLAMTWYQTRKVEGYGTLRGLESPAAVQCPDKSTCPDGATCCQLSSKQYACCPYDKGVCCEDKLHCCPHDMTCDLVHSRCVQGYLSLPWNLFTRRRTKHPAVSDLRLTLSRDTCPDLTSVCEENTTCCQTQSGAYGCCPHKNAVCCSDKLHCCPYGTTCDVAKQSCKTSDNSNDEKENSNNDNGVTENYNSNDIPFPAVNPYHRFN